MTILTRQYDWSACPPRLGTVLQPCHPVHETAISIARRSLDRRRTEERFDSHEFRGGYPLGPNTRTVGTRVGQQRVMVSRVRRTYSGAMAPPEGEARHRGSERSPRYVEDTIEPKASRAGRRTHRGGRGLSCRLRW